MTAVFNWDRSVGDLPWNAPSKSYSITHYFSQVDKKESAIIYYISLLSYGSTNRLDLDYLIKIHRYMSGNNAYCISG